MRFGSLLGSCTLLWATVTATSTQGIEDLIKRRLPDQYEDFLFTLDAKSNSSDVVNDTYTISTSNGSIALRGNSPSALATGLRRYFTDVAHSDIYWFIGSQLDQVTSPLPRPDGTITGESIVPWRYYFNTGSLSQCLSISSSPCILSFSCYSGELLAKLAR
jgi:alpha-N-acetylglucosaminidase